MSKLRDHPSIFKIDVDTAAIAFRDSLMTGTWWDHEVVALRPELSHCGSEHLQYTLDACYDQGLIDHEIEDIQSKEAYAVITKWCQQRAVICRDKLGSLEVTNGHVRGHRIIACDQSTLRAQLGIFWSHDIDNFVDPYAPWGEGGRDAPALLIEAMIPITAVNWPTSHLSLMDWMTGDSESELRLYPNHPLIVVGCTTLEDDQPVDIPGYIYTS